MFNHYPVQYKIGAAPIITLLMVMISIIGRLLEQGTPLFTWPLMACLPVVFLLHIYLLIDHKAMNHWDALFYALVHIPLAFVVWTFALMHLTGSGVF